MVRDAQSKGLAQIAAEMKDLAARAREKKLKPQEYMGGTFSISNLGMMGIRQFASIINPPEGMILSVGAGEKRAVVKLASTPTAKNLIRVFFLQERLKSVGGKESGIHKVHVVGAGVMGGDIAAWSAYKGFEVTLQDREQRFIDGALTRAAAELLR